MAHDVFISYSSKDKSLADAMCANLENNGIRCWIAPRDILPGKNWGESIIGAIHESKLLVLVLSSNSNKSSQIVRELERAVDTGIPIIPFRVEEILPSDSISYFIAGAHWLDALTPPLEEHINSLARTINILLETSKPLQDIEKSTKEFTSQSVNYETLKHNISSYKTPKPKTNHIIQDNKILNYESMPESTRKAEKSKSQGIIFRIFGGIFALIFLLFFIDTVASLEYYIVRELYGSATLFAIEELLILITGLFLGLSSIKADNDKNRIIIFISIIIGIFIIISLFTFPYI